MPELPEVETVRRGLERALCGRRLTSILVRRPALRHPLPDGLAHRLAGATVAAVERRGKVLLVRPASGPVLVVHLGMAGRFVLTGPDEPAPAGPHDHVALVTADGPVATYRDPRRFGYMALAAPDALAAHAALKGLGPDPLRDGVDGPALARRLAGRRGPVKPVLLDQGVVAGLGNIYACEILYRAGLSPRRRAGTIAGRRATRLAGALHAVLTEAVAAGGSSLRDHATPDGEVGLFQHAFAVYGRAGAPCPACPGCSEGVRRIRQAGRSTFYCPRRQR